MVELEFNLHTYTSLGSVAIIRETSLQSLWMTMTPEEDLIRVCIECIKERVHPHFTD